VAYTFSDEMKIIDLA